MDGQAGPGFEYGRLEIFLRGIWSTICDYESFTPDSAAVACRILGFDGGATLEFRNTLPDAENAVLNRSCSPQNSCFQAYCHWSISKFCLCLHQRTHTTWKPIQLVVFEMWPPLSYSR